MSRAEEVERALGVGQDPDGVGAAYVEGVTVTEPLQRLGSPGDRPH